MSLLSSLKMAGNTLQAMQIGLHVVGNNIANANTPGYVRERAIYTPAPVQRLGNLTLGMGVEIAGIVQVIDKFAESRLRDAGSDLASAEVQDKAYRDLQAIVGELTDVDINSALTQFFNGIELVANEPENIGIRDLVIKDGLRLVERINALDRRVTAVHGDFSQRIVNIASEVNTLTEEIRQLNLKIVINEGGGSTGSDAGGLRSQRSVAIQKLAELVNVKVSERETGAVNISVNGELLVFEGTRRQVKALLSDSGRGTQSSIQFVDTNSDLKVTGGELHGIYEAQDQILGTFLNQLDELAATLAFEFNKIYSQGQGIDGFTQVTSTSQVNDPDAVLNQAGLPFDPINGSFNILVRNKEDGITKTHNILVDLNGMDGDDITLNSLASAINAIDGLLAEVNFDNQLVIRTTSSDIDFSFGIDSPQDESGLLAALGINTFFTGDTARNLGVNSALMSGNRAGAKFAASSAGLGEGTGNALRLIGLYDESLDGLGGSTIRGVYDQLVNQMTQGATIAGAMADGLRVFEGTMQANAQAVSGVNVDEEAITMIMLQHTYQASARYIRTLSDLLDVLISI